MTLLQHYVQHKCESFNYAAVMQCNVDEIRIKAEIDIIDTTLDWFGVYKMKENKDKF